MGLDFPAGKALEELAKNANYEDTNKCISPRLSGANFHFSGQENQAAKALQNKMPKKLVASQLFCSIADTLIKSIVMLKENYNFKSVLFSGGVMANGLIKDLIRASLKDQELRFYFAPSEYARDNAVGNGLLGMEHFKKIEGGFYG